MNKRSVLLHQFSVEQSGQFDRFFLGATLAACAYLGQTNPFGQIGFNVETMYLLSLLVVALSAAFGFKRIESVIGFAQLNSKYLHSLEMNRQADAEMYGALLPSFRDKTGHFYRLRNTTLALGFFCYVATKVFASYLA